MARNVETTQSQPKKKVKFEVSVGIFLFRQEKEKSVYFVGRQSKIAVDA